MDSLTQVVLGAAVAEHFTGHRLGNRALLYGGAIATIPDLDVFVGQCFDVLTANEIHRGFSHSIAFFIMSTPLLGWFVKRIEYKRGLSSYQAYSMVFWCLCTHALLDAFTNWGTQLFWPIEYRVAIQSIFVIDPLYTLPFIYCMIRVMMRKRQDDARREWNRRGLIISSSYLLLTLVLQFVARQQFAAALDSSGTAYEQLSVRPAPLTAILWNANVKTTDGYLLGEYSFFDSRPITFMYFKQDTALLNGYQNDNTIQRLIAVSEGWYTISRQHGNLYFNDLRFGLIGDNTDDPEFVFRYKLNIVDGHFVASEAESPSRTEPGKLLKKLGQRILGN